MLEKKEQEYDREMGLQPYSGQAAQPPAPLPIMPSNPEHVETDPWILNPPPEFKYEGFKGMSKETYAEMMKPVVPWEECTAWRLDPSYKARKRAEERKKEEEEFRAYMKKCRDRPWF